MNNNIRQLITLIEQNDSDDEPLVPINRTDIERKYSPRNRNKLKKISSEYDNDEMGSYYIGKQDPRDPHAYRKHEISPNKTGYDAYVAYVEKLAKLNGSNPYLPVVYHIKRTGQEPHIRHKFTLEKLTPIMEADTEHLLFILKRLIRDLAPSNEKLHWIRSYREVESAHKTGVTPSRKLDVKTYTAREIIELFKNLYKGTVSTQDAALNQALDIVRQVIVSSQDPKLYRAGDIRYELDFHTKNIMLRNTSRGYWPVFNDPVS